MENAYWSKSLSAGLDHITWRSVDTGLSSGRPDVLLNVVRWARTVVVERRCGVVIHWHNIPEAGRRGFKGVGANNVT